MRCRRRPRTILSPPGRRSPSRRATVQECGGSRRPTGSAHETRYRRGAWRCRHCAAHDARPSNAAAAPSAFHDVEEMATGAVLDFDNPDIWIELELAAQVGLDVGIGRGLRGQAGAEPAIRAGHGVEYALRRGAE